MKQVVLVVSDNIQEKHIETANFDYYYYPYVPFFVGKGFKLDILILFGHTVKDLPMPIREAVEKLKPEILTLL
jgi:hypothetical protein